ncbi:MULTISPECIES: hypothetical protein [Flavobacteriaceae]|uniref:TonB C-terminal domain-containing protein n=2 Tax=Flavobacteriaceae TaxID=49546 RepID=A0A4Y8AS16_9FLAO|nr:MULTISPECIES: hypothetical protein [Flavobacteriaceae]TEW73997.1 hypothetical protein E2488_11015 [Gramella jeungdoensis]GGK39442.1 hypothetical protein GCM10007963_04350 [Lutibacter litoralis]
MKKFKLIAIALVIGTSSLFATTTSKLESPEKTIRTEIIELLKSPDFNIEKEVTIILTFTFSSEGEIVVLNVNSKNPEILNFIRKNLNYHKITNPGERDKLYTMPLKMKIS